MKATVRQATPAGNTPDFRNLEYWVGNKKMETIIWNQPIAICKGRANKLKLTGAYKAGEFKTPKVK